VLLSTISVPLQLSGFHSLDDAKQPLIFSSQSHLNASLPAESTAASAAAFPPPPTLLPSLVFLDCHMPLLDGFATAAAIRQLGFGMPLVTLTGSVGREEEEKAQKCGFDRYLNKPIQRPQLREALQLAVEYDRQQQSQRRAIRSVKSSSRS